MFAWQLVGGDLFARRFVRVNREAKVLLQIGPVVRRLERHHQLAAQQKERNTFHRLMAENRHLDAAAAMGFRGGRFEAMRD